ncbi:Uu.00g125620.m01.CDS01 [Anthostomella pinea]|uniref:Uu.00g125620.m01.CDS01 n=1 Tax=Anthostomella pinea TaxID=933095 RepID=A0AAI8VHQ6_9PEZI|nr:Uu.00g125620.m01.CDS01 [Anthostomella pinea]
MDVFLAKLSYHATSYAIRTGIALTSTYVIQQGSRLLKTVDDDPLRRELSQLQRRLARKIEVGLAPQTCAWDIDMLRLGHLISPILESIELRYTRGDSALETVVRTARALREDIDSLGKRLKNVALDLEEPRREARDPVAAAAARRAELLLVVQDTKELLVSIDDSIPLINLWVSAIGGIQEPPSSFSPSRLLQASMLVTVGDTQFILDPNQPMQIGPDFTLSLYMLFRGHASADGTEEAYGVEEGQRKPMWQEVIHKARVRLCRVPLEADLSMTDGAGINRLRARYAYQLQVVEDLEDGRVHTFEEGEPQPTPYDGVSLAGIREDVAIHQISKMFYADVGKILNINNDDGASSNPVLLLKRDPQALPVKTAPGPSVPEDHPHLIENIEESAASDDTLSEGNSQDDIDRQLQQEIERGDIIPTSALMPPNNRQSATVKDAWRLPQDLDPEWMALEVFEINDDSDSTDEDEPTPDEDVSDPGRHRRPRHSSRPSVDTNLVTQMNRMGIASSRPSSRDSQSEPPAQTPVIARTPDGVQQHDPPPTALSPTMIERSPFGAIKTSLSLLEMLLRLTSLQEFEQTTHLAIPDHVLKFYLGESASTSGLHGKQRWAAGAEAERKVGFDPYADPSG